MFGLHKSSKSCVDGLKLAWLLFDILFMIVFIWQFRSADENDEVFACCVVLSNENKMN